MGKPSSTQLSRNSSSHSIKSTKSNMGKDKTKVSKKNRIKKQHLKLQRSIHKLFDQLRDTSQNSQLDNSVIDLDDTTIVPNELRTINEVSIVITDDDQQACSTARLKKSGLHTSTPKRKSKLDDLILSSSNNDLQSSNNNLQNSLDRNSMHTIDLTGFNNSSRNEPTVIDLVDSTDDVTLIGITSNTSSMSGDSDVTVLRQPINRKLRKFTHGIQNLNAAEKGKLLELITETIFNGCNVQSTSQPSVPNVQKSLPRAPETVEDTYIKEMILNGKASRTSVGSNVYHPDRNKTHTGKRMVVIDGSNVAMEHGRGQYFSVRGLQICIEYFLRRGHVVKAFVPRFRCKFGKSTDPRLLDYLERTGLVIYTPSREVQGRSITPYDDSKRLSRQVAWYIIQCAAEFDAVIVTGDNYRDLVNENPRWRAVIETRLLPFTWVDDMIMFPRDPLGRNGPTLEEFLRHTS